MNSLLCTKCKSPWVLRAASGDCGTFIITEAIKVFSFFFFFFLSRKEIECECWFSGGSVVKNLPASAVNVRDAGLIPGLEEDALE